MFFITACRASISISKTFLRSRRIPFFCAISAQSLLNQEGDVTHTVFPRFEFLFADPLGIIDRNLAKAYLSVSNGLNLDLFAKSHAVTRQRHFRQNIPPEDPHSGLGIADTPKEQHRYHNRQNTIT